MTDQASSEKPSLESKQTDPQWLLEKWTAKGMARCIAWWLVWFVVLKLVGLSTESMGRYVGGDLGMWLGWAVFLLVSFALCGIVARIMRKFDAITFACIICIAIESSNIGQEAARHYGAEKWAWLVGYLTCLVVVIPLALMLQVVWRSKRQE